MQQGESPKVAPGPFGQAVARGKHATNHHKVSPLCQKNPPKYSVVSNPINWTDYDRLKVKGNSRRVIAKRLGIPLTTLPRADKAHQSVPVNGDHGASTTLPQRIEIVGAPLSASAHSDAPARISPPVWVDRGTHLAADMLEAVKTYTRQHRLEMRGVIDTALRRFFGDGER